MYYSRSVTTVHSDGTATKMNVGDRIAEDDVQHSMEEEHNRLSRLAMETGDTGSIGRRRRIESVTEAGTNIVVIYDNGAVKVHHWVQEEE